MYVRLQLATLYLTFVSSKPFYLMTMTLVTLQIYFLYGSNIERKTKTSLGKLLINVTQATMTSLTSVSHRTAHQVAL